MSQAVLGRQPTRPASNRVGRRSRIAIGLAAMLFGGCVLVGRWLTNRGVDLHLGSAFPLSGHYGLHVGLWLSAPITLGLLGLAVAPRLTTTLHWPAVLAMSYAASAGWAVALAAIAGPAAIAEPLTRRGEYLADIDRVNAMSVTDYLDGFSRYIVGVPDEPAWTTHVAGHPPLTTLAFALLNRAGLTGPGWAAALCIVVGAGAAPAVLSTLRQLAGEVPARRAAPFMVFAPTALWVATSADAIFAGTAAAGICALAHAGGSGPRLYLPALTGGLALGVCLMLSYGLVLLAPIAVAVVLLRLGPSRQAVAPLLVTAVGALGVLAAVAASGFWWPEGLRLTVDRVKMGPGWQDRPTAYFLFANVAALAVAVGPAVVAALPCLPGILRRRTVERPDRPYAGERALLSPDTRRLATPAVAALLTMTIAIGSNLSKGEVERIYLPFTIWLLPLAALVPAGSGRRPPAQRWLAAQIGWALMVAATTKLAW